MVSPIDQFSNETDIFDFTRQNFSGASDAAKSAVARQHVNESHNRTLNLTPRTFEGQSDTTWTPEGRRGGWGGLALGLGLPAAGGAAIGLSAYAKRKAIKAKAKAGVEAVAEVIPGTEAHKTAKKSKTRIRDYFWNPKTRGTRAGDDPRAEAEMAAAEMSTKADAPDEPTKKPVEGVDMTAEEITEYEKKKTLHEKKKQFDEIPKGHPKQGEFWADEIVGGVDPKTKQPFRDPDSVKVEGDTTRTRQEFVDDFNKNEGMKSQRRYDAQQKLDDGLITRKGYHDITGENPPKKPKPSGGGDVRVGTMGGGISDAQLKSGMEQVKKFLGVTTNAEAMKSLRAGINTPAGTVFSVVGFLGSMDLLNQRMEATGAKWSDALSTEAWGNENLGAFLGEEAGNVSNILLGGGEDWENYDPNRMAEGFNPNLPGEILSGAGSMVKGATNLLGGAIGLDPAKGWGHTPESDPYGGGAAGKARLEEQRLGRERKAEETRIRLAAQGSIEGQYRGSHTTPFAGLEYYQFLRDKRQEEELKEYLESDEWLRDVEERRRGSIGL